VGGGKIGARGRPLLQEPARLADVPVVGVELRATSSESLFFDRSNGSTGFGEP
jgi:hypothetical protein